MSSRYANATSRRSFTFAQSNRLSSMTSCSRRRRTNYGRKNDVRVLFVRWFTPFSRAGYVPWVDGRSSQWMRFFSARNWAIQRINEPPAWPPLFIRVTRLNVSLNWPKLVVVSGSMWNRSMMIHLQKGLDNWGNHLKCWQAFKNARRRGFAKQRWDVREKNGDF